MAIKPTQTLGAPALQALTREALFDSPFMQLESWLRDAVQSRMPYPTAMTLATLGADGGLDQRTVLLRHCDARGLIFFAGDYSKKIRDLQEYPGVSVHFFWHELDRQVRVRGMVQKVSAAETTHYFITPPDFSLPQQSCTDAGPASRQFLIQQFNMMRSKFYGGDKREKSRWSGYRIVPDQFEFWQGGGPRLRDRFLYRLMGPNRWSIERLEE
jgi:pyridoxamine 5'-phosphate oxidase